MTKEARMDWVRWVLWKARNKIWQTWSDYQMQSCGQFRRPFSALVSACGCSMSSFIYDAILSIDFFMYIAQGVFFIPFPYLPTRKMRNTYKYEKARFRSPGYLIVIDDNGDDDDDAHSHEDWGGDVNCHRTSCIVWAPCLTSLSMMMVMRIMAVMTMMSCLHFEAVKDF